MISGRLDLVALLALSEHERVCVHAVAVERERAEERVDGAGDLRLWVREIGLEVKRLEVLK